MAARPLATDLSGGKTSEDSFTTSMTTLAEEYVADIQFGLFWVSAPLPKMRSEDTKSPPPLGVDRVPPVTTKLPARAVERLES